MGNRCDISVGGEIWGTGVIYRWEVRRGEQVCYTGGKWDMGNRCDVPVACETYKTGVIYWWHVRHRKQV